MKTLLPFLLIGWGCVSATQAQQKVFATVDDDRITLNETVTLRITAEDSDEFPRANLEGMEDFTVISGPAQSTSLQWVNGKMSSSRSLSWTLIPNDTGSLTIPPLEVGLGTRTFKLDPITVTVVASPAGRPGPSAAKGSPQKEDSPLIFLRAEANKKEAFRGEQITVHYRLYARADLQQYTMQRKPQGVGFWQEVLYAPKQPSFRDTQVEGVRYRVATVYEIALFSTTDGDLSLEPMILDCTVKVPSRTRFPSPFDDFFSDPFSSRTRRQVVQSPPLTFVIKPVPQEGRPENYTGAVGQFSLSARLDTSSTRVNEAVAYTLELKGTGNLNLFQVEEPSFPVGLDVYQPKTTFEKDPFRDEISGTKTWEYILIPRKPGRLFLPETKLVYFDPNAARWETASAGVQPLTVIAGDLPYEQAKGLTKEEIALLGQDIRYIRSGSVKLKPLNRPLVPATFWLLSLVGVVLFAGPGMVRVIRSSREERMDGVRARRALKQARKRLKRIGDSRAFNQISRTISVYLSSRLGVASTGIDAREVRKLLDGRVSGDLVDRLAGILALCDETRYAPSTAGGEGRNAVDLAREASEILKGVDRRL